MPLVLLLLVGSYLLLSKSGKASPVAAAQAASTQAMAASAAAPDPTALPTPRLYPPASDAGVVTLGAGGSQTPLGASASTTATAWDIGSQLTNEANANEVPGTLVHPTAGGWFVGASGRPFYWEGP